MSSETELDAIDYCGRGCWEYQVIRSQSIRYGLDMLIEGLLEVYDSVVEWNGQMDFFSKCSNYFLFFD
jgi:hypothetical protein